MTGELTLQERVRLFNLGTPTAMHVGTHELVNDLWRELEKRLENHVEDSGQANAVRSSTAAHTPGTWEPIETAPKNEKFVLLYVPDGQLETGPVVMGLHWRDEERDDNGRFKKGRWLHCGDGWLGVEADCRAAWCEPTHWMPLPAPPTSKRAAAVADRPEAAQHQIQRDVK